MKQRSGFTLVEMMAVIAVITILALMAIPSYLDRIVKAQIEAALPLAEIAKGPISAYWAATQTMPADNVAAALPVPDKIVNNHVSAVTVREGSIDLTFGNRASRSIAGKTLSLRPAIVEDAAIVPMAWVCGFAEAPTPMTIKGQNRTDVDPLYLPMACRSLNLKP